MHVLLFLVGLVMAAAGAVSLGFGINDYRLGDGGHTLITSGVTALVGGPVLLGLGSIAARLQRILSAIETQPFPRPVGLAPLAQEPAASKAEAGAETLAAPTIDIPPRDALPRIEATPPPTIEAKAEPVLRPPVAEAPAVSLDLPPPRAGSTAPPVRLDGAGAAPAASAAADLPRLSPLDRILQSARRSESVAAAAARSTPEPDLGIPRPPQSDPAAPAGLSVLKSGVIEGMAYTLYSNGAVDAELPQGTMRFASIAAWRAHMRG